MSTTDEGRHVSDTGTDCCECPTCGRSDFESEFGVKCHHARAHGESLSMTTLQCGWCDDEFDIKDHKATDREYCSEDCRIESLQNRPTEEHPRYKPHVELSCEWCREKFEVSPSQADRRTCCSKSCMGKLRSQKYCGEDNPRWKQDIDLTCPICDMDFSVPPSTSEVRVCCSKECASKRQEEIFSEFGNPNHSGGGFTTCRNCDGEFYATPHEQEHAGTYCSRECMAEDYETRLSGENGPSYKPGAVITCSECGSDFRVPESEEDSARFCSRDCLANWQSDAFSGQDSHHWKPGSSIRSALRRIYGDRSWNEIRQRNIGDQCRMCESSMNLHLHHIIPLVAGGDNGAWNLMTLCASCHRRVECHTEQYVDNLVPDRSEVTN